MDEHYINCLVLEFGRYYKISKENIELIEKIEKAIVGQDITFSRFVILACEYALNNMEKEEKDETSK